VRVERRKQLGLWFVAGAVGGLLGPAALSGLLWFSVAEERGILLVAAVSALLVAAVAVHRHGGIRAARLWALATWFVLSGLAFAVGATLAADLVPLPTTPPPSAPPQAVIFTIALAIVSGTLAVVLALAAGRLARKQSPAG